LATKSRKAAFFLVNFGYDKPKQEEKVLTVTAAMDFNMVTTIDIKNNIQDFDELALINPYEKKFRSLEKAQEYVD
jgi:hypothetical protein